MVIVDGTKDYQTAPRIPERSGPKRAREVAPLVLLHHGMRTRDWPECVRRWRLQEGTRQARGGLAARQRPRRHHDLLRCLRFETLTAGLGWLRGLRWVQMNS